MNNISIILNPASLSLAQNPASVQTIKNFCRKTGARLVEAARYTSVFDTAKTLLSDGAGIIVAAGGDGTVSSVAKAVAYSTAALGVLPVGTKNHFAKDAGIPQDLDAALAALRSGRIVSVDMGKVNGELFLNNVSLGLYPLLVRNREEKQWLGWKKYPAHLWSALRSFADYPEVTAVASVAGQSLLRKSPVVVIGNNPYNLREDLATRATLDAGTLSLYVAHGMGRWGLFKLALAAAASTLRQQDGFDEYHLASFSVRTLRARTRAAVDGELVTLASPLEFSIQPKVLKVVVPETSETSLILEHSSLARGGLR